LYEIEEEIVEITDFEISYNENATTIRYKSNGVDKIIGIRSLA